MHLRCSTTEGHQTCNQTVKSRRIVIPIPNTSAMQIEKKTELRLMTNNFFNVN